MNTESISLNSFSSKLNDYTNPDQSLSGVKVYREAFWHNHSKKANPNGNQQSNKKSVKSSDVPSKRWGHSAVVYKNSMLLFGGRHSTRSLANLYYFDFSTSLWTKVEPLGQIPPARDSHSCIVYKNELIVFGGSGSGKKLNDLWTFNIDSKKWSKISASGDIPQPREGHSSAVIRNNYMMIYGGLDEEDNILCNIYLLDLRCNIWHKVNSNGECPSLRDSQSCAQIYNICYIFGGQGVNDKLYNDMYTLTFEINETDKKFNVNWVQEDVHGVKPQARTSHTCVTYKSQYLIIIAGEGLEKIPLNDVWMYNISVKTWCEVKIANSNNFDGRLCHSSCMYGEKIYVYGGMKNAETTLDSLSILCLDGKTDDLEEENTSDLNTSDNKQDENYLMISNNLSTGIRKDVIMTDVGVDTEDLIEDNHFDFEALKKNYLNNMISWNFLKKLSDLNQWPLGCIANFIDNSIKAENFAKLVEIDVNVYDKKVYVRDHISNNYRLTNTIDTTNKIIVLSVKDDGCGISVKEFNQILYSFSVNEKKEFNFFRYGISLKASALRLANSLLIISKTKTEVSIGLISKNLQIKMDTDFILTPVVNYSYDENKRYTPMSNFSQQSLNIILNEIKCIFHNFDLLFEYFESFETGTHIYLYDLKQISSNKNDINKLNNYELLFDFNEKDILFNCFESQIGDRRFIDCSLFNYLNFLYLNKPCVDIILMGKQIDMNNPYMTIFDENKIKSDIPKANSSLKIDKIESDIVIIDNDIYKGVLFNKKYYNDSFNGILLYKDNRLVSRFDQTKLGDISFFVKKFIKCDDIEKIFTHSGFVELKGYELLYNKTEFKDQGMYAVLYSKIKNILKKLNNN